MMAAPRRPFDVAREIARPRLTAIEQAVLEHVERAAEQGLPAPSSEALTEAIGANGVSTVPGILKRLEAKGYIRRTVYQRGREICILSTGQCTAPPRNTAPHWRFRTDRLPSPAIQSIRSKAQSLAPMIEAEARIQGKALSDFLADLAYIGWHEYQAEKERGE